MTIDSSSKKKTAQNEEPKTLTKHLNELPKPKNFELDMRQKMLP